ncbi:alpha/beta hydrolase family protein [Tropicimonas sp.]|uniref:alpha/beta hydrolase family protein n=1 Tax=Tropicimonas sp. TaxID=2067044 RepID=UPI003A8980B9
MALIQRDIRLESHGDRIAATLTEPGGRARARTIVMLHGHTGTRAEFPVAGSEERFFELAARRFAEAGHAALRFDFRGSGESCGRWRDTTFDGQAGDVLAVLAALRRRSDPHRPAPVLLGFSQGGLVALRALARGASAVAAVLWNPVLDPRQTYAGIYGEAAVLRGIAQSRAGDDTTQVGKTGLNAGFFRQIARIDPIADATRFPGPLMIVSGTRDRTAADGPQLAEKVGGARSAPTTCVLKMDTDHVFDAGNGPATVETVIEHTLRFIRNLK